MVDWISAGFCEAGEQSGEQEREQAGENTGR